MKTLTNPILKAISAALLITVLFFSCKNNSSSNFKTDKVVESDEKDEYEGPGERAEFEFMRTKDPALGYVPTERLMLAKELTMESKARTPYSISAFGVWEERGPISDVPGPSNGNTRANNGIASGRIRAMLVDKADATGKTLFIGGVDGGIWKTTDITLNPAGWVPLTDNLNNLAISDIVQDPTNLDIMYFCTGESFSNFDAVRGVGVFKSVDHGVSWTLLPSTSTFVFCTRIVCDASGNIYLGTNGNGILRSINGGNSWTNITPTTFSSRIADVEISSTGRLHITTGLGNSTNGVYRFTDIPTTVSSTTWTSATTPFPYPSGANCRVELGCRGNTLYALPSNTTAQVPTLYKSTDGGVTWAATLGQPASGWTSGQAWYALSVDINPADLNQCIVGGLDTHKTLDGGITWTKISEWVGTIGQYVHADQHKIIWYDGGNKLLFGCDGGVHYSTDGGVTIRDRNTGLRIKQFYSIAAHPTNVNYFLGGTQDNGTHQFNNAGLSNTIEVTGGDGAYAAIDQDNPAFQFGAFIFNTYRRSTNSGANWQRINFYTGATSSSNFGNFINVFTLDNNQNIIYAAAEAGNFFRWTDPETLGVGTPGTLNYFATGTPSWPATASQVNLTALNGSRVFAVTVSPYTANRVYFGTEGGRVCYAEGANTIASNSAGVNISTGLPTNASVSCIGTGTNDNNLIVCYSNYGVSNIWISSNNGTSWTNVDGNLPDMPVRWCMFAPGNNSKAIIATETGVWFTQSLNGASTVWVSSPGFPAVRTDMLAYRASDGTVAAATHGRGLWTQTAASILPLNNFTLRGRWTGNNAELNWSNESLPAGSIFEIETSTNATTYSKVGAISKSIASSYSYNHVPPAVKNIFYRIKSIDQTGVVKYSNIVRLSKTNSNNSNLEITKLYPNPVEDLMSIGFNIPEKGMAIYSVTDMNGKSIWRRQEKIEFVGSYNITEYAAALAPGTYIFSVMLNGKKSSQTFIKK